jgi:ankyrin repeat protein
VDREGITFLHVAVDAGNLPVARQLVVWLAADVNVADVDGVTPLHMCVDTEDIEMVKFLLKVPKIDLSLTDSEGNTAKSSATGKILELFNN